VEAEHFIADPRDCVALQRLAQPLICDATGRLRTLQYRSRRLSTAILQNRLSSFVVVVLLLL